MKFARLLIAAAILAALGGLLWWSNRTEAAKAGKPDAKAPPKILELKEADIKQIEIQHHDGETTVVKRGDGGKWSITAPQPLAADQTGVGAVTSAVTDLSANRLVDANPTNLPSYGLDPPQFSVTFTMADGKTHTLRVGDDTPTDGNTYAMLDGDKRLFTITSFSKGSLDKQSKDLREKHLLVFDQDKLSRVELDVSGKTPLEFGRAGTDWQILKPKPMRADGSQVDELLNKLKDASMDTATDAKTAAAAFAGGQKIATAKVTGPEGTETLEVRKAKDDYYAKSSMLAGAYKITKEVGDGLNKSLEDFRNKKIFDFGFNDPNRIEIKDGGQTKVIEKSGENWTSGGKTMDSISVQNLIDKLRDLTATKFVDSGFTTPSASTGLELTVVSNDGKRTEKVQIAPAGSNFLAKRENDSTLYQLDSKAVADLRDAANGVKEPPPPETKDGKKK